MNSKYNNLLESVDRLTLILTELGEEGTRFLTEETRKEVIESLVESLVSSASPEYVRELARVGFGGFNNYSDLMLVQEELACSCSVTDREWDSCPTYPQIDADISAAISTIITREIEKDIL